MRRVGLLFRHMPGIDPGLGQRLQSLNQVFAPANLTFVAAGATGINGLASVQVGACPLAPGGTNLLTPAQRALFQGITLGGGQMAVFLAGSIQPGGQGCAAHPPGKPGVVVTGGAGRWVLAHEVGHALGLGHAAGTASLMRDNPQALPAAATPTLSVPELSRLAASPIPRPVFGPLAVPSGPVFMTKAVGQPSATTPIARLADDALAQLPRKRVSDVVDRVATAVQETPSLRRRYRRLVETHGRRAVHSTLSRRVRETTGMEPTGRTRPGTSLLASYAVLRRP